MGSLAEEILSYFGTSGDLTGANDELLHYGMPFRSGRYPYGSGDNPYQHYKDFLGRIKELKKSDFKYTDEDGKEWTGDNAIAKSMGLTSSEYRRQLSWATYEKKLLQIETAKRLREKEGMGFTEIGREMGLNESTVRSLLQPNREDRMNQVWETVNFLKDQADKKGMIDIGGDVYRELGVSKTRLDMALDYLSKAEGYPVYGGRIDQLTNPGQYTTQTVLCTPGTKNKDIYNFDNVKTITDYVSPDNGDTYQKKFNYPASMDSKRMMIRYNEEGGLDRDGLVEIRPGVPDLSLGNSKYAQVRILVDGTHYIKGMAAYSTDMPDGVDVIFNTNKKKGTPIKDVLKEIKPDPDNPFGSLIKDADQGGQYWYTDPKTGKKKLGLINKRAEEGDWSEWADALPSQFLSKQSKELAKQQLNIARDDYKAEFDEICSITNPTIKKHLLEKFADKCDSAAVDLKAAALPGQKYHVIIPINTLKDTEIYAPGYEDGTKLALIRYPHGGIFEIPILTVNNKNQLGSKVIGRDSMDAVGINHKIADQLSGADFDGDAVMCIPTHDAKGRVKIANKEPLKELEGFDPKVEYGGTKVVDENGNAHYFRNGMEYPIMKNKGTQMGSISNLITDMTLAGASDDKIARAVRHSMDVIDAEKHKLDYKASEIDNNIAALKKEYQPKENGPDGGASTIISKSKGQYSVDKRQGSYHVNMPGTKDYDPSRPDGAKIWKTADDLWYPKKTYDGKTGEMTLWTSDRKKITYNVKDPDEYERYNPVKKVNKETGEITFTNKAGDITYQKKKHMQQSTKMAETDDAYTLVSAKAHPMELIYADYANSMKALANQARIEMKTTKSIGYSSDAKKQYQNEVNSLNKKLNDALLNSTRERAMLRMANSEVKKKTDAYEQEHGQKMKNDERRKLNQQTVTKYRQKVGSVSRRDRNIDITDREWDAIQSGAVSETTLKKILNNTDIDKLRDRATPKVRNTLSEAKINRIKAYADSNYTLAQIASKLGVSTSTVSKYLKGAA